MKLLNHPYSSPPLPSLQQNFIIFLHQTKSWLLYWRYDISFKSGLLFSPSQLYWRMKISSSAARSFLPALSRQFTKESRLCGVIFSSYSSIWNSPSGFDIFSASPGGISKRNFNFSKFSVVNFGAISDNLDRSRSLHLQSMATSNGRRRKRK